LPVVSKIRNKSARTAYFSLLKISVKALLKNTGKIEVVFWLAEFMNIAKGLKFIKDSIEIGGIQ
jgi:hypothetical protein